MRLDGYLRIKDVANELDVSYVTVLNYIKKGYLKAFKSGGQWKVSPKELKRFKDEGNIKEGNKCNPQQ